jgi:hypothetical protein
MTCILAKLLRSSALCPDKDIFIRSTQASGQVQEKAFQSLDRLKEIFGIRKSIALAWLSDKRHFQLVGCYRYTRREARRG